MYDERFEERFEEWLADFDRVRRGELDNLETECYPRGLADWLQDDGVPPNPDYYRPWKDEEAIWFQVWETVSEGTPVSPAFETKGELIDYLAENGDFWDQKRCHEPDWQRLWGGTPGVSGWGHERAKAFVNAEWAPSMVVTGGQAIDGKFAV
ncbi:MAG: hypothetical protein QNJ62_06120 [Methyloceanibacter sp.]|nr:hypothetical protein [Methyloceanibacter sp.]